MNNTTAVATILVLCLGHAAVSSAQSAKVVVSILEDTNSNQWCAFTNKPAWQKAVNELDASSVGELRYENKHLAQIYVAETDESGDWIVYDTYLLDNSGNVTALARTINVLPGDRSVLQHFSISAGVAQSTGTRARELSTGKPVAATGGTWLPDVEINTTIEMFPFAALIRDGVAPNAERHCAPTRAKEATRSTDATK